MKRCRDCKFSRPCYHFYVGSFIDMEKDSKNCKDFHIDGPLELVAQRYKDEEKEEYNV